MKKNIIRTVGIISLIACMSMCAAACGNTATETTEPEETTIESIVISTEDTKMTNKTEETTSETEELKEKKIGEYVQDASRHTKKPSETEQSSDDDKGKIKDIIEIHHSQSYNNSESDKKPIIRKI